MLDGTERVIMRNRILELLRKADGYVSGEEMSRTLSISRAAVWKHIKRLRAEGYDIVSAKNNGYRLGAAPDEITPDAVKALLRTRFMARNIEYKKSTGSTNEDAKRSEGSPDGTLFIADIQTAGKGRRGRAWNSPPGSGIWMSLLLKPDIAPERVSQLTLIAGIAVCRAIGGRARIKWPNDIVIGTKKVSGILTELSAEPDMVNYAVCGIGINVNTAEFPAELKDRATSLYLETGSRVSRAELIARVMNELEPLYERFLSDGFAPQRGEYRDGCVTIGREVKVTGRGTELSGTAADVDEDGKLIIDTGGRTAAVTSGEVSVRGIYGYV